MAFGPWADNVWNEAIWATGVWEAGGGGGTAPTISIDEGATADVLVAATLQLNATTTGSPSPTVSWGSSDDTKATVNSSSGLVTGVAVGSATITGTATNASGSQQDTILITVTDASGGSYTGSGARRSTDSFGRPVRRPLR